MIPNLTTESYVRVSLLPKVRKCFETTLWLGYRQLGTEALEVSRSPLQYSEDTLLSGMIFQFDTLEELQRIEIVKDTPTNGSITYESYYDLQSYSVDLTQITSFLQSPGLWLGYSDLPEGVTLYLFQQLSPDSIVI